MKRRVIIIGAGRVGRAVAHVLSRDARYQPVVADIDRQALRLLPSEVETSEIGFSLTQWLQRNGVGATALICAGPAEIAPEIARSAREAGCLYLDCVEDASITRQVAEIAEGATTAFAPGCGLAPGLVGALALAAAADATPRTELVVMAGVLPCHPTGRLGYADFWGVDGLISEYTGTCLAIRGGRQACVPSLAEHETVVIDAWKLEAFTTSGTLDRILPGLEHRIKSLTFKTLRTAGHLDYIRFLLDDMGLADRLYQFKNLLLNGLQKGNCDRVFVHILHRDGRDHAVRRWSWTHCAQGANNGHLSVSLLSAEHIASVLDRICERPELFRGLQRAEAFPLGDLTRSPFFKNLPAAVSFTT